MKQSVDQIEEDQSVKGKAVKGSTASKNVGASMTSTRSSMSFL